MKLELPEVFDYLFEPARYKGAHGGRGSAKSHSFARGLVVHAVQKSTRILCAREIQKSIKESVKKLIEDVIDEMQLTKHFKSTETGIEGRNGSQFLFAGLRSNPDMVKSQEGIDIAWIEEANRVSQRSLNILIPTIRKPGSEIWATWNPELATDPIDKLLRQDPHPNAVVKKVNYYDNPWFPEVLRDEMEWDKRRDPDKYAHVWLGDYLKNSEARVFKNWRIDTFEAPADARFLFGGDWGFSIDPTVLVRMFIKGKTLFIDYEAYKVGCEIDKIPELFDTVPRSRAWDMIADSARPETISYLKRHGFPKIKPAVKGARSIEEGIEFIKTYDIVVHPRCTHVIDEFTLYSYKVDELTGNVLPILGEKKNHTIDSIRYGLEPTRRAINKARSKPIKGAY